ncbi:MAG: hypothetical protein GY744_09295 [Gammaproteobacteria bacterium]|nr:hypothetical protein [Gammaproteobacteria bacterium]
MPLTNDGLRDVQGRVNHMFMDTIGTIELINKNADVLFGKNEEQVRSAINEYMEDFIRNTNISGETHPEVLIYEAPRENYQRAGLYGSQLAIKERQVTESNSEVRESLTQRSRGFFRSPFKKWIDRINNFLGSLASATGVSEALKELKDCLRDELPDDDE